MTKVWIESEYYLNLESEDKKRYKEKLTLSNGELLPNPSVLDVYYSKCIIFKPTSDYDRVTAEENEDSLLPEPLTSLFDYNAINMEGVLLQEFAVKNFSDYESCFSQDLYDRLTEITISPTLSNVWRLHRVGRITASNFYDVIHCKFGESKTLLNKLMNYVAVPPNLLSLVYGSEMEAVAKKSYTDLVKKYRENLMVHSTGLHSNVRHPHLGASPDGITVCDCHGKALLEIKCPHKYCNGLEGWQDDKNFPLDESGQIKKDHMYYPQVQGQLLILDMNFCDFFIWTPLLNTNVANTLFARVHRDADFILEMIKKLNNYFFTILLPEIVTRRNDVCLDNKQKNYCICNRPCFEPMIACDRPNCKVEWYHYACVKVTRAPKGSWIYPPCLVEVSTQSCSEKYLILLIFGQKFGLDTWNY